MSDSLPVLNTSVLFSVVVVVTLHCRRVLLDTLKYLVELHQCVRMDTAASIAFKIHGKSKYNKYVFVRYSMLLSLFEFISNYSFFSPSYYFLSLTAHPLCCSIWFYINSWNSDENTDNEKLYAAIVQSLDQTKTLLQYSAAKL